MAGFTNHGKYTVLNYAFLDSTEPTYFYVALVTTQPRADTNTLSDLTEVANGNGYTTGGAQITRDSTGFDVISEDDVGNRSYVQLKNVSWSAVGGSIPASGSAPRYAVLLDDNATVGSRIVLGYWDLGSDRTTTVGNVLALADLELSFEEK